MPIVKVWGVADGPFGRELEHLREVIKDAGSSIPVIEIKRDSIAVLFPSESFPDLRSGEIFIEVTSRMLTNAGIRDLFAEAMTTAVQTILNGYTVECFVPPFGDGGFHRVEPHKSTPLKRVLFAGKLGLK